MIVPILMVIGTISCLIVLVVLKRKNIWFNDNHYEDASSEIFLSCKDFIDFYNLNPDRYEISYDCDGGVRSINVKGEYEAFNIITGCKRNGKRKKYKIKFKFFSFIKFYYWDKHRRKINNKQKYNKDMREMLELVQEDIDSIRERAEKEIREAERITNEVGGRL